MEGTLPGRVRRVGICLLGGEQIDLDSPDIFHEATTWSHGPGRSIIVSQQFTGKVACRSCVTQHDRTDPRYKNGWLDGFRGQDEVMLDIMSRQYQRGYRAGEELREYLDGYFFFEETI